MFFWDQERTVEVHTQDRRISSAICRLILCCAAAALPVLPGCGRKAPPPPTERMELVARFFESVKNNDSSAAMRQGVKLRSLDRHNESIARLVEIQQCNSYIGTAQKMVNAGDIAGAVSILEQGVRIYPDNITLRELLPRVRQLRNAKNLIGGMRQAANSVSMRSALTAAKIGLAANETPALRKYFSDYERKIIATEREEKIREEMKARAEAAERAKQQQEKKTSVSPVSEKAQPAAKPQPAAAPKVQPRDTAEKK